MLSILHREMRVASRRPWTFRVRLWTNIVAFVLAAPMLVFYNGSNHVGAGILKSVTFVAFWFCLLQGVRWASGSIGEEKREGTLGLLFLTDQRPHDIIAGKLFGIFLPMIQPVAAFLPTLMITVLLGGTTGWEIARAGLVLMTVLIFSISIGLFVSAFSRRPDDTGKSTMALLLALTLLPLLFYPIAPRTVRLISPWVAFGGISDVGYRIARQDFWYSMLWMVSISTLSLIAASFYLPRRWEESQEQAATKPKPVGKPTFSEAERQRILSRNPGEWLALQSVVSKGWRRFHNALIIGLIVVGIVLEGGGFSARLLLYLAAVITLIRIASQASFGLCETKRSGAVEMILSTPLNPWLLVRGQITVLWSQFQLQLIGISLGSFLMMLAAVGTGNENFFLGLIGCGVLNLIFWAAAVVTATVGMCMGLKESSPNSAFFRTIVYVYLIPVGFFCLWFMAPIWWIGLFAWAVNEISGQNYRRLLAGEKSSQFIYLPQIPPVIPR